MGLHKKWISSNGSECIHFVTTNTLNYQLFFLNPKCCDILVKNISFYRKELGFILFGYSILPDHFHGLFFFNNKDEYRAENLSERADNQNFYTNPINNRMMGSGSSRTNSYQSPMQDEPASITDMGNIALSNKRQNILSTESSLNISKILHRIKGKTSTDIRKELHIHFKWQKYFYDFQIYTQKKFLEKLKYIHNNQYRDSRILDPDTYPYSSMTYLKTGKGALKVDEIEL